MTKTKKLLTMMLLVFTSISMTQGQISFAPYTNPYSQSLGVVAIANLDGVAPNEVVVAGSYGHLSMTALRNTGSNFAIIHQVNYSSAAPVKAICTGKINQDANDEVVIAFGDSISAYSLEAGLLVKKFQAYSGFTADGVNVGDLDGDGFNDIGVSHWHSPHISVFWGNGNFTFTKVDYPTPNAGWDQVLITKLGLDTSNSLIYMRGQGMNHDITTFTFGGNRNIVTTSNFNLPISIESPNSVAVGDVNGDGSREMVVTFGGNIPTSKVAIWRTYNNLPDTTYSVFEVPRGIVTSKLDCDVKDDIVVCHGALWSKVSVNQILLPTSAGSNILPTAVASGDVNNDGKNDIVIADNNFGLVYLENTTVCTPLELQPEVKTIEVKEEIKNNVFPNPTTNDITIEVANEDSEISITNSVGVVISIGRLRKFCFESLASGIYYVTITSPGARDTHKIVKL